jgi:hypothetical protein
MSGPPSLDQHYRFVVKRLCEGRVVPFLGAGANICGRPSDVKWRPGQSRFLPTGSELAASLADYFEYPSTDRRRELARISQYASVAYGPDLLYEKLHEVFDTVYAPTVLHRFLARLPRILRRGSQQPRYPAIVTTNYDDALERAFHQVGEPFDLLSYIADGPDRGKFVHHVPSRRGEGHSETVVVDEPNKYDAIKLTE